MFDPERLLGEMIRGNLGGAFGGRRKKRKSYGGFGDTATKAKLGVGLLGIAIAAWEHYKGQGSQGSAGPSPAARSPVPPATATATPPPPPPPPTSNAAGTTLPPPPPQASSAPAPTREDYLLLIRTMIAAAAADGVVDATERAGIIERAREAGFDAVGMAFLEHELERPATLAQITAAARPDLKLEVYAAAALAIDPDTEAEQRWLDSLAQALALDAEARARVDREVNG